MGFGGISIWQLVIILAIVLLLFGAKKLRNVGADLGSAVKGFKGAMKEGAADDEKSDKITESNTSQTIEGEVTKEKEKT